MTFHILQTTSYLNNRFVANLPLDQKLFLCLLDVPQRKSIDVERKTQLTIRQRTKIRKVDLKDKLRQETKTEMIDG